MQDVPSFMVSVCFCEVVMAPAMTPLLEAAQRAGAHVHRETGC